MICQALQSVALAPVPGVAWLCATSGTLPPALARRRRSAYASDVPEKEGNGFDSPNYTGRRAAPCGYFFVCIASVRLQWAAMAGSLRAAGFRVYRSVNPAICRPPRLTASGGVTTTHGGHMPSSTRTSAQSHGSNAPVASQKPEQSSIHQPFSWFAPQLGSDVSAQFVARTMDVCHGRHSCLDLVNPSKKARSGLAYGTGDDVPLLDRIETERLLRFAMASAGLLAEDASIRIQWMNEHA
jgi:hypothetical protein